MAEAKPEETRSCTTCRHCIEIGWTEKIVCLAFLQVRLRVGHDECPEFTPLPGTPQVDAAGT